MHEEVRRVWIPVECGFPAEGQNVLIRSRVHGVHEAVFLGVHKGIAVWVDPSEEYFEFQQVSHWMPMPVFDEEDHDAYCYDCKNMGKQICTVCSTYQAGGIPDRWEPRPVTNGDLIRAKTDDKMASWLALHPCLPNCPAQTDECFKYSKFENCKKQWLNWLRQEANDA